MRTPIRGRARGGVAAPFLFLLVAAAALVVAAPVVDPTASADHGIDLAGMDTSVAPGADFFEYANGTWLKTTPIPPEFPGYSAGLMVFERTQAQVAELIHETADAQPGSDERKIADYYATYLDVEGIDARGLTPLRPLLDTVAAIGDRSALARHLGGTLRADVDAFNATNVHTDNLLGLWVAADLDEPTRYVPFLLQGGLDMPDRAYYVDESESMTAARAAFLTHVTNVLTLVGAEGAVARADRVADLERRMAEVHWSRTDTGDLAKGSNHWSRADFAKRAPGLDWDAYFAAARLDRQRDFVVWQPGAVTGLSALAASEPLHVWKDYLTFHAVEHFAQVLPRAFVAERFSFHGKVLAGIERQREREKLAISATSKALGDAVGRLYVERHFPPESKSRIESMVRHLIAAFGRRIDALEWMAPETKARAREKLAVLRVGIGYPDCWRDYSGLQIVRGEALGNALRMERFDYEASLARLGQPVDRSEWVMTPQTVNAVNLPVLNAMNFPAAILQPPFFDARRPVAMDYGAIGAVIGHEISHSFDDQGAKFDAAGRLKNWWTDADRRRFEASSRELVEQYDAYHPFPDLAVDGELTLGENIADVAGLAAAYDAYRLSLGGGAAPVVEGLSGDQQFFIAFAQTWRGKTREPALRQQIVADSHAPARYRVLTVRNLDAWYRAFGVKAGQDLYLAPEDRVQIW